MRRAGEELVRPGVEYLGNVNQEPAHSAKVRSDSGRHDSIRGRDKYAQVDVLDAELLKRLVELGGDIQVVESTASGAGQIKGTMKDLQCHLQLCGNKERLSWYATGTDRAPNSFLVSIWKRENQ